MNIIDITTLHNKEGILTNVDFGSNEDGGNTVSLTLNDKTYTISENPDDGYRSYHRENVVVSDKNTRKNFEIPVKISYECGNYNFDGIHIIDARNGEIILEIGTNVTCNYYPYFVGNWVPENIFENKQNLNNEIEKVY